MWPKIKEFYVKNALLSRRLTIRKYVPGQDYPHTATQNNNKLNTYLSLIIINKQWSAYKKSNF